MISRVIKMREKLLNMFKISIWNKVWSNIGDKLSKSQKHDLFCQLYSIKTSLK